MSEPLLALERVVYRYPRREDAALRDVQLEVGEGEFVVVAGDSASGKSTLLRAANGLVPHFYGGELAGRVTVRGLDTRAAGPARLAEVTGSVFQDPESQSVMTSVGAELALPLESRGWQPVAVARAVEEVSLALGIGALLERPMHTLSGGELQRVALGAALAAGPRLLVLDEPTSQLDPVAGDELIWQLRRLNEEWGMSILLAEHRLERCLAAADRVVALEAGRVACDAPPPAFVEWACERAPTLVPPAAAMFTAAGLRPRPVGVRAARARLHAEGLARRGSGRRDRTAGLDGSERDGGGDGEASSGRERRRLRFRSRRSEASAALALERVWVEYDDGPAGGVAALRSASLRVEPGETVALLGRNGAGKSTLLRVAAGLQEPDRGRVHAAGSVALLLQCPSDYFLRERVSDELPEAAAEPALRALGLTAVAESDPRDLSGGERQRLALAIVLAGRGVGGGAPPAVVALDEPTRGMDRSHKSALARRLRDLARAGSAVVLATHEVEFAARAADRCVILGQGQIVADGRTEKVLSGGRYFATEVARVLGPEVGAVLPEHGADELRRLIAARGAGARPASGIGAEQ